PPWLCGRVCGGGPFRLDELGQHTTEVYERPIRQDREHLEFRILIERLLLPLDDRLVLHEALYEAVEERARDRGVVTLIVIEVGPEEVGRPLGLGCHELTIAVLARAREIALLRSLPRGREERLHGEDTRYEHRGDVAPVDLGALVGDDLPVKGRRIAVVVPAFDAKAPLEPLDGVRLADVGVLLRAAERTGVYEREMGEIAQVVDDQQIVGIVVQVGGYALPLWIPQIRQVDDQRRVRQCRISHPDPDERALLDHRIAAYAQPRRDHVLTGNLRALAGAVVFDAVIHAADGIALATSPRQQRAAMRAAVVERDHLAAVASIEQYMLSEQRPAEKFAIDELVIDGAYVPTVPEKHGAGLSSMFRSTKRDFVYYSIPVPA